MKTRTAEELYDQPSSEPKAEEPEREAPAPEASAKPVETPASEKPAGEKPEAQQVAKPVEKAEDESDQEHVPDDLDGLKRALAAARGDKRKARKSWQETERKLAELEGKLAVYQQHGVQPRQSQEPQPTPQAPDLDDLNIFDPKAIKGFVEHQIARGVGTVEQRWFERNRSAARERHPDFDDLEKDFLEAVKFNPGLGDQADNSPDPAEFAYKTAKTLREMRGVNSMDDLKAKIRAELEAEIKAAQGQQVPQAPIPQTPAKPQIPKSLASVRGTGVGIKPEWRPHTADELYNA